MVHKVDCKVLSIGNLTLGGTGKTPMVVFFAIYLISLGKKVAILSRGYGRATKGMVLVSKGDGNILCSWQDCGDEPYMIANKLKGVLGHLFLVEIQSYKEWQLGTLGSRSSTRSLHRYS